jgi:serine O-acetyltransferase
MTDTNELIRSDLFRYTGKVTSKFFLTHLLFTPGFRYTFILRKCHHFELKKSFFGKISRMIYFSLLHHYSIKYSLHIPPATKIGYGLYLGYGENITITGSAVIGNNVNLNHGAAIGKTFRGTHEGAPIIGDCVWIGTNAVVVGKISIGNGALIAPLSHVNFDVPENAVVAGNPAKIVSLQGSEGYVTNKWE